MTPVTNEPDPGMDGDAGPELDAEMVALLDYLTGDATIEATIAMNQRFERDADFRARMGPIVQIWTLPHRLLASADVPLFENPRSIEAQQAEWDRFFRTAGMAPVPVAELSAGIEEVRRSQAKPVPAQPEVPVSAAVPATEGATRVKRPRRVLVTVGKGILVAFAVLVVLALPFVPGAIEAWPIAVADFKAGHEQPAGVQLFKATVHQARAGQDTTITTPNANVTLHGGSRLAMGTSNTGAIDGEADIVVPWGKRFVLWAGGIPFGMIPGRYEVSHPLGGAARIVVDSGIADRLLTLYRAGTVITAMQHGTQTTIRAVLANGDSVPPVTLTNDAIRP